METNKSMKQYGWLMSKFYSIMVNLFFKDSYVMEQFESRIDYSKTVLELGSGPGIDYEYLRKHYDVTGSDYSDAFLKTLRKKNKQGKFIKLNALDMDQDEKYDVIVSNKVLQHLTAEQLVISLHNQYESLNDGGVIFHAMWRGYGNTRTNKSMPFVKYQPEDIEKMTNKFKVKEVIKYKEMQDNDSFIIIMEKLADK